MTPPRSRAAALELDAEEPLRGLRELFELPAGLIYLDGNSLGPVPRATAGRLAARVGREWGEALIAGWSHHDWLGLPRRLGARLAPLLGAEADEVLVADSTSVNLFKVVAAACALRPARRRIVTQAGIFPTDRYVLDGLVRLSGRELEVVTAEAPLAALAEDVACVVLSHVDYRSGALHDLAGITAAVHAAGGLVVWDLSHSAGAVPIELGAAAADFAVGCGYKYLNGGPGAPAFLFVARRHQAAAENPLSGWLGHRRPFGFEPSYQPAAGIDRFQTGTPPVLALTAFEVGIETVLAAPLEQLRAKSLALSETFIALVEARCPAAGLTLLTPREAARRGSQVAFRHPHAEALIQALAARGVVGDFRPPDVLRFGLAPLYVRFVDLWDAVEALREALAARVWEDAAFEAPHAVP